MHLYTLTHTRIMTFLCIYIERDLHAHTHTHIHTYTHTYTHTHMYTPTYTYKWLQKISLPEDRYHSHIYELFNLDV